MNDDTQQTTGQGQTGDQGAQPTPPPEVKRVVSDEDLGIGSVGDFATSIKIPPHNLTFDEAYFLKLMSGSISLMKEEKIKIIESVPKLSQYQVDELIRILEDEKRKFAELDEKHQAKVMELQQKQQDDWQALEMQQKEAEERKRAEEEAAKIRQQIGGGDMNQAA